MKTNHADITIVLDRSGSMASVAPDTIGGFNTFLADQQKAEGTAALTLNQFDNVFERVFDSQDIKLVHRLTSATFIPRGSTALLDAIGRSINDTGKRISLMNEDDRPDKVIMVIITDGYENASHQFDAKQIGEMITHQRDTYKWEFVFLGADQDAIATAASYNIPVANAMTFAKSAGGVAKAYAVTSSNLAAFRSGSKSSMSYDEKDREEQKEEMNK